MLTATMVVATIPVTDLERAKQFYGETLGLELLWETPVAARFRSGTVSEISVFKRPPVTTDHTLAHFEVGDIEAEVAQLVCRGVEFLDYTEGPLTTTGHIAQLGPAQCAWFLDPDRNTLGIRQG
jgi:catechol 2,3-dioxygenase-like lactoylglutathione lyase family enzyme